MRNYTRLLTVVLTVCLWQNSYSQANAQALTINNWQIRNQLDSVDARVHQHSRLSVEMPFMSRVLFSGRDYGLKGIQLAPQINYFHKSGLTLSAVGYYWSGVEKRKFLPKTDIGLSYAIKLDDNLSASFGYSRWIYYGKSRSELRWTFDNFLSTYWTINCGVFGLSPSVYYMTSPAENVVQTALTASKYFQWSPIHGGKLIFEPNITAMMSTNDRYYKAEPDKKAGKVLRIINYELVLPFTFRRVGQYDVTARMHLTLPFNTDPWDGAKEGKTAVFFSANVHYFLWKA